MISTQVASPDALHIHQVRVIDEKVHLNKQTYDIKVLHNIFTISC